MSKQEQNRWREFISCRWVRGAAVFVIVFAALFFFANIDYFSKRIKQNVYPQQAQDIPEKAINDEQLIGMVGEADKLVIPSLSVEAPIVYVTERTEEAYQSALKDGVGHFPSTAEPGDFGNAYIFGHSSDFIFSTGNYQTVFATLPDVDLGAAIYVTDRDGNAFRYLIKETKIVEANDLSALEQYDNQKKMLTLQTSYPIGTALQRFLVIAELDAEVLR